MRIGEETVMSDRKSTDHPSLSFSLVFFCCTIQARFVKQESEFRTKLSLCIICHDKKNFGKSQEN